MRTALSIYESEFLTMWLLYYSFSLIATRTSLVQVLFLLRPFFIHFPLIMTFFQDMVGWGSKELLLVKTRSLLFLGCSDSSEKPFGNHPSQNGSGIIWRRGNTHLVKTYCMGSVCVLRLLESVKHWNACLNGWIPGVVLVPTLWVAACYYLSLERPAYGYLRVLTYHKVEQLLAIL